MDEREDVAHPILAGIVLFILVLSGIAGVALLAHVIYGAGGIDLQ